MNFLSHFYFDRKKDNPYEVLGMILPDLLKNANKSWNIFPEKYPHINSSKQTDIYILNGWKRHLLVDKIFHNSDFFHHHQHQIKLEIKEFLKDSPAKPFFIGHIALELMLDSLLITERMLQVDDLYLNLEKAEPVAIESFLNQNGIENCDVFFNFFNMFKREKYLASYADPQHISYALKRISMRIWKNPFTTEQENALTEVIIRYLKPLKEEFIFIFDAIEHQLVND